MSPRTQDRPAPPVTLAQRLRTATTAEILETVLDTARDMLGGQPLADQLAPAARALQTRSGRLSAIGTRDLTDRRQQLAEEVDQAAGFLAISSSTLREALGRHLLDEQRAYQYTVATDPDNAPTEPQQHRRDHLALLREAGLDVFPARIPAGELYVVVYEPDSSVGQLLTALAKGELTYAHETALLGTGALAPTTASKPSAARAAVPTAPPRTKTTGTGSSRRTRKR
ncbi:MULTISPECIES: hypothetical protein [unclassified Streptomyces]|uniref:hypothetical protein n=1 Tax=unclassified Streptomyces TaxID=2593676 RepID=UPI002E29EAC2|nr:hypothetical protein [Streptomyces sp. NBC_00228]